MFACPSPADSSLTFRLAPSALLALPPREAVSVGLNGRFAQPLAAYGLPETVAARALRRIVIVAEIACAAQLVGVEHEVRAG